MVLIFLDPEILSYWSQLIFNLKLPVLFSEKTVLAGLIGSFNSTLRITHKKDVLFIISSVQFSRSVMSDSLRPNASHHARPPCPSPNPRVHLDSRPLSQWCHLAISSSVVPFSSCPQSFPASESFPMSQLFTSGGQSIGVSASKSVLPMNT